MADVDISRFIDGCMKTCIDDNVAAIAENSGGSGQARREAAEAEEQEAYGRLQEGLEGRRCDRRDGHRMHVHNRIYQLTHLLENGHAIKNQTGKKYGDVPATALLPRSPIKVAREFSQMGGNGE